MSDEKYSHTRSFMIRYQEEEVEINDLSHFRISIPIEIKNRIFQGQSAGEVFMEVELMFADL